MRAQLLSSKVPLDEPEGRGTDDHCVGRSQRLEPGRNIRCLAQCQVLLAPTTTHLTHHDHPGMDTEPHGQTNPVSRSRRVFRSHGLDHPKPGPHCPLRIVFMRQGVTEVDEQAIAQILRDMPIKARKSRRHRAA